MAQLIEKHSAGQPKAPYGLVGPHQRCSSVQQRAALSPAFRHASAEEAPKPWLLSEGSERPAFRLPPSPSR